MEYGETRYSDILDIIIIWPKNLYLQRYLITNIYYIYCIIYTIYVYKYTVSKVIRRGI